MSQPVLVKVYGSLFPAGAALAARLEHVCKMAVGPDDEIVTLENGLLRLAFEGVYFPADDVLEILENHLEPGMGGRLDVLDIEHWMLYRHLIEGTNITSKKMPLNNVLDYSGH